MLSCVPGAGSQARRGSMRSISGGSGEGSVLQGLEVLQMCLHPGCPGVCAQLLLLGDHDHSWLAAAAAGDIGRGDEAPWDGALVVAEAARGGDTVEMGLR